MFDGCSYKYYICSFSRRICVPCVSTLPVLEAKVAAVEVLPHGRAEIQSPPTTPSYQYHGAVHVARLEKSENVGQSEVRLSGGGTMGWSCDLDDLCTESLVPVLVEDDGEAREVGRCPVRRRRVNVLYAEE